MSDALSPLLRKVRVTGGLFSRAEMWRPFAVETRGTRNPLFHVILKGAGQIRVGARLVPWQAGDLIVLPRGSAHIIQDPPGTRPDLIAGLPRIESADRLPLVRQGAIDSGPPDAAVLCGTFGLPDDLRAFLLPQLPELLVLRGGGEAPNPTARWLDQTLQLMASEVRRDDAGGALILARLAEILFVQVLRHGAEHRLQKQGFLAALSDPQLSRALRHLHEDPAHNWTGAELARRSGVSRAVLFERFQRVLGAPPRTYLTRLRMLEARRRLRQGAGVFEVASAVGYSSEAAFSRAFKRQVGASPSRWRKGLAQAAS